MIRAGSIIPRRCRQTTRRSAFLYPGQGSQSVNMLRDLVVSSAWSRDLFAEADRLLADELPRPLIAFRLPDARVHGRGATAADGRLEGHARSPSRRWGWSNCSQPTCWIASASDRREWPGTVMASTLLCKWPVACRVRISAFVGRSGPLCRRGCPRLSRRDGLRAGRRRATAAALKALNLDAYLANRNAPDQTVIAGPVDAIAAAVEQLAEARFAHCAASPFPPPSIRRCWLRLRGDGDIPSRDLLRQAPRFRFTATRPANRTPISRKSLRGLLAQHFSEPVLFEKEVRQIHADGARVFLEVGPGKVLTDPGDRASSRTRR